MSKHPITVALENVDVTALAAALSEDVVFHSPILATVADEIRGRDLIVRFLGTAIQGLGAPRNVVEYRAPDGRYITAFDGEINGHPLNVQIAMSEDADGKVNVVAPHLRPYPIVTFFREYMRAQLCPDPLPDAIWELPARV